MLTKVPANLTLQKFLRTSLVLFPFPLPITTMKNNPSTRSCSTLLSMGPLEAANTLLSITQLIFKAELT